MELKIPQVRGLEDGGERFYTQALDKGPRGERALTLAVAVAKAYVQGGLDAQSGRHH